MDKYEQITFLKIEEKKKLDYKSVKFKIRNQQRKSVKLKAG